MASDQQIVETVDSLLWESTPGSFTTLNDVVHILQSRLGFDLSHKIDLIRARVIAFYSPRHHIPPSPPPQPRLIPPPQTHIFTPAPPYQQLHYPNPHPHQGPVFRNATEISFSQPSPNPNVASPDPLPPKDGSQSRPKKRGGAGGLNKLCGVSPELQTIVGQPAMTRTEIVKQLWVYIRKNNLQDPSNKRKIICNDELRLLFETDATDMFQMNKLLSKHILPLDPSKEAGPQSKKVKVDEEPEKKNTESNPNPNPNPKPDPSPNPNPNSTPEPESERESEPEPVVLSEALASFLGESGREMPQSEVFERFSEYIKAQGLEDPSKSVVICDAKLQELLGCESIPAAGIYDMLARNHLFQRS